MEKLCECGCGDIVNPGRRFVKNHQNRTNIYWGNQKRQVCECGCGEYTKPGNKFIRGHQRRGAVYSEESRKRASNAHMGQKAWNKGTPSSKEAKDKMMITKAINMKPRATGYCDVWSYEYKNDLRKPACERCGLPNMTSVHISGTQLCTHHKNGKSQCAPNDIITLCRSCHVKVHTKLKYIERITCA